MKEKKFAVILSGCGVFDGSEIHESVLTLLAISKLGHKYEIFAPNIEQYHVVNHLNGEIIEGEKRNVLVESARIARGKIKSLNEYDPTQFDCLVIPGGYGVAKNLSSFAFDGENMKVLEDVKRSILETHKLKKPIGAWCIAPIVLSKVLGNVNITLGQINPAVEVALKFGSIHTVTGKKEVLVDKENKIVTTPCYMLDSTIAEIYEGIEKAIEEMVKLTM